MVAAVSVGVGSAAAGLAAAEMAKVRIDRSIENIEKQNNLVALSPEEYEAVVKQLSRS